MRISNNEKKNREILVVFFLHLFAIVALTTKEDKAAIKILNYKFFSTNFFATKGSEHSIFRRTVVHDMIVKRHRQ